VAKVEFTIVFALQTEEAFTTRYSSTARREFTEFNERDLEVAEDGGGVPTYHNPHRREFQRRIMT
jgi:hypothetical protein